MTNGTLIPTFPWEQPVCRHVVSQLLNFLILHAGAEKAIVDNMAKVTEAQLLCFLQLCWVKYVKARIEPGKALTIMTG
jgi:hypothetical protein